jgi:hypothetical protein
MTETNPKTKQMNVNCLFFCCSTKSTTYMYIWLVIALIFGLIAINAENESLNSAKEYQLYNMKLNEKNETPANSDGHIKTRRVLEEIIPSSLTPSSLKEEKNEVKANEPEKKGNEQENNKELKDEPKKEEEAPIENKKISTEEKPVIESSTSDQETDTSQKEDDQTAKNPIEVPEKDIVKEIEKENLLTDPQINDPQNILFISLFEHLLYGRDNIAAVVMHRKIFLFIAITKIFIIFCALVLGFMGSFGSIPNMLFAYFSLYWIYFCIFVNILAICYYVYLALEGFAYVATMSITYLSIVLVIFSGFVYWYTKYLDCYKFHKELESTKKVEEVEKVKEMNEEAA